MNVFADTVANLRYRNGVVSVRLAPVDASQDGVEIHMPFLEFVSISETLSRQAASLREVHQQWLKQALAMPSQHSTRSTSAQSEPRLGKRLGSV